MPAKIPMDVEELRRLYFDCGLTCEQAAVACGLGAKRARAVGSRLSAAGYKLRAGGQKAQAWPVAEMVRLYQSGMNSDQVAESCGVSATHVRRLLRPLGVLRRRGQSTENRRGDKAPRWAGGRSVTGKGYVFVYLPGHPLARNGNYVAEHRLVAAEANGIDLDASDEVHHINGVKSDNRPENLQVVKRGPHQRLHANISRELWALRREVEVLRARERGDGECA